MLTNAKTTPRTENTSSLSLSKLNLTPLNPCHLISQVMITINNIINVRDSFLCTYFTRKYINDTFFFPTIIIIIIFLHIVQDDDDDDDESLRTYFLCFLLNSIFINLLIII